MGHHPSPQGTQTYINESPPTLAATTLARGSWPAHRPIEWVQPFGDCMTVRVGGSHKVIYNLAENRKYKQPTNNVPQLM